MHRRPHFFASRSVMRKNAVKANPEQFFIAGHMLNQWIFWISCHMIKNNKHMVFLLVLAISCKLQSHGLSVLTFVWIITSPARQTVQNIYWSYLFRSGDNSKVLKHRYWIRCNIYGGCPMCTIMYWFNDAYINMQFFLKPTHRILCVLFLAWNFYFWLRYEGIFQVVLSTITQI